MRNTTFLFISFLLLLSCDKVTITTEDNQETLLDGWVISKSDYAFDINPRDMFFVNQETGFVVGYRGDIIKTTDSGKSWKELGSGTTLHLHSVFFLNESVGFVSSQAMGGCLDPDCNKGCVLLKTIDGGETWTKTFFTGYTRILSLKFFDELKGIAIIHTPDLPNSRDEFVATTSDGGATWSFVDLSIKPCYDKLFFVENTVFVAGENQKIFKSSDFGLSWKTINTPIEASHYVRNIYFYNENTGFIDGITAFYKTTNGGENWKKVNFPFNNFETIHFYTENEGFNIESRSKYNSGSFPTFNGSISYVTTNGGVSWSISELQKSLYLGLTCFPQKDLGFGFNLSEFCIIKRK